MLNAILKNPQTHLLLEFLCLHPPGHITLCTHCRLKTALPKRNPDYKAHLASREQSKTLRRRLTTMNAATAIVSLSQ